MTDQKLDPSEVPDMLDKFGEIATGVGSAFGGPVGIVAGIVRTILSATAAAIRSRGDTVDEILARIEGPKPLDTSFRSDIDRRIAEKPKR